MYSVFIMPLKILNISVAKIVQAWGRTNITQFSFMGYILSLLWQIRTRTTPFTPAFGYLAL